MLYANGWYKFLSIVVYRGAARLDTTKVLNTALQNSITLESHTKQYTTYEIHKTGTKL